MRTTLDVGDDILAAVRALAAEKGVSLGAALSDLARRELRARLPALERDLPVFAVDDDAPAITPELVRKALDDP